MFIAEYFVTSVCRFITRLRADIRGSVLVETIGSIVLIAFMASGLLSIAMTLQVHNELRHVAAVAARTGAIAGVQAADDKVETLLQNRDGLSKQLQQSNCDGIDYFEVRLSQGVRTLFGVRQVEGVGHAISERQ